MTPAHFSRKNVDMSQGLIGGYRFAEIDEMGSLYCLLNDMCNQSLKDMSNLIADAFFKPDLFLAAIKGS